MKLVFPMTGSNRFLDGQYYYPKPIIDVAGKTMFENALEPLKDLPSLTVIAAISQRDVTEYNLDQVIKRALGTLPSSVKVLSGETAGALCTTLLMSDQLGGDELIISNYDQDLGFNVGAALRFFRDENADFGVISFNSIHPKWSYVRISDTGAVIEAAEKNPISKDALVGLYYFRSSDEFIDAAKRTILAAPADKEQFFISEVINTLVLAGMAGVCYKIEREEYRNFYDSSELKDFIERAKAKEKSADDILANTKKYISAFAARDLAAISDLMENNAILYDSSAGEVKSRDNIIQFVEQLFSSHETLSFEEKRVIVEGQRSVIEFVLKLDSLMIRGVDIIDWHNGKIQRIDAYLEVL